MLVVMVAHADDGSSWGGGALCATAMTQDSGHSTGHAMYAPLYRCWHLNHACRRQLQRARQQPPATRLLCQQQPPGLPTDHASLPVWRQRYCSAAGQAGHAAVVGAVGLVAQARLMQQQMVIPLAHPALPWAAAAALAQVEAKAAAAAAAAADVGPETADLATTSMEQLSVTLL
jgi:hypothetical protein